MSHEQEHEHDHDHEEECCCGHDHDHEHHHHDHGEDECNCGHEHHHHHHDDDDEGECACGHEHHHHDHEEHDRRHAVGGNLETRVYNIEGLDCANCAAKIERKLNEMPEVEAATITFASRQLRVSAKSHKGLLEKMQEVTDSVEDGVTLSPRTSKGAISKTYILEGLDCANCAAKIETKLCTLPGVEDCSITFATKQMRLTAKNPDSLIPAVKATIDAMEDGITIVPQGGAAGRRGTG